MQYPVPQFTDVEDKLIGSLTMKQFGIIFGAGIIIVMLYTSTKSITVAVAGVLLLGLPAIGLAFAPFNGRPIYNSIPVFIKFFKSDKFLVFHKETNASSGQNIQKEKVKEIVMPKAEANGEKLTRVTRILKREANAEQEIINKINSQN
jgi:hypothetical protein